MIPRVGVREWRLLAIFALAALAATLLISSSSSVNRYTQDNRIYAAPIAHQPSSLIEDNAIDGPFTNERPAPPPRQVHPKQRSVGAAAPPASHPPFVRGQTYNTPGYPMPLRSKKTPYPARKDMGACPPLFGKVSILILYNSDGLEHKYKVAMNSWKCYLAGTNYTVIYVNLDNDVRYKQYCYRNKELFFQKHCAASVYLADTDWLFVIDADTGVVNPNHCIEEWIDDRVDLLFYERFFNFEIMSGNYLARNTEFSRNFLRRWAEYEFMKPPSWNGADNGVLQILILETVLPDAHQEIKNCYEIWTRGTGYDSYMAYVMCVKLSLGANRIWGDKLRIYRRGQGFARDGFLSIAEWCEADFLFHGWKGSNITADGWGSPFTKVPEPSECGVGWQGWPHAPAKKSDCTKVKRYLANHEKDSAAANYPKEGRVIPHLILPDVGECWPRCEENTDSAQPFYHTPSRL